MNENFDAFAWLAGLGSWFCSAVSLFVVISAFDLNPIWFALSLPVPFVTVAVLYQFRLKSLPKLARQLGDLDKNKRQEAFKRLMDMGQNAVDVFQKVIQVPRKKEEIADWNGIAATILAVEGLGRLKAKRAIPNLLMLLRSSEREICERVIWALGEIGDQSVIPELLPFLGSEFLNKVTAKALGKIGASDLVDLFDRAMKQDKMAIETIRKHQLKNAFVAGFIRALWSHEDISLIPKAAWALAELWATEAIPPIQAQIGRWLPAEVRKACQEAVNKLEMISKLPRAVSPSEIDTSTLPRPVTTSEVHSENLPRAASLDEDLDESKKG